MKVLSYLQQLPNNFKKIKDKTYIAVVGSRDINDYEYIKDKFLTAIAYIDLNVKDVIIVSGGARGVDTLARKLAKEFNIPIIEILPDWDNLGKKAGILRNDEILKISDIVVAFPLENSKGTYYTINKAKDLRITVFEFHIKKQRSQKS